MTTVIIGKNHNGSYKQLTCMGHSGFADSGSDIVCASVSVLVINTLNVLEELGGEHFTTVSNEEDGFICSDFEEALQDKSIFLLDAMVYGLQSIEKQYGKKYLKVKFEEV